MRVDVVLADSAQTTGGKAYILGAGWSLVQGDIPMAVIVFLEVPWTRTNERIDWMLELVDPDGVPVRIPTPDGDQAIRVAGNLEVGRPPGVLHGTPITPEPITVNVEPLPLQPGRYTWRFLINGDTQETWQRTFQKVAPQGLSQA